MRDFWHELKVLGVDLVVAAHEHMYERFTPMNGNGEADHEHGVAALRRRHRRRDR